jgi:AraC-like DNA-binding protein/CheY-like chemotaxis protein
MLRVMIVDDEPVSQNYIRGLIAWEAEGFFLFPPVYSGEEARKILDTSHVDMVLLDVSMPGENGVSVSRYIREYHPRIVMLAISSHDDYDYVREILKNGAYDYILKHRLNAETLHAALRAMAAILKGVPVPDREEKRERIQAWLFGGGTFPFLNSGGRTGISVARVPMESLPEESRAVVVPGIISLAEKNMGEAELTIAFREPDLFVICVHFHYPMPEKKIGELLTVMNQKNQSDVRLVYNLDYYYQNLLLQNPAAIPGQVRRLLESFPGADDFSAEPGITLSVFRRKMLTSFLTERNYAGTELVLHNIFSAMSAGDQGAKLAIVRDLSGLLRDFAKEGGLPTRFYWLTRWANNKPNGECEKRIREAYRQLTEKLEKTGREDAYVRQARIYMLDHYTGNISLENTAAALNISPSYLSRVYKKETGRTFVDALTRIRVDAAKACLLEGMNLKSAASFCGFRYYNYFIKVFKDYTGITPSEFIHDKII